jgi:hypothetical protein
MEKSSHARRLSSIWAGFDAALVERRIETFDQSVLAADQVPNGVKP